LGDNSYASNVDPYEREAIMNRRIARIVTLALLTGAAALVPTGVAFAQQATDTASPGRHHGHREGLLGAALKLDSLTPAQRTAIEQLEQTRRTAEAPVRQADAQLLTALAQQVEQASINRSALAPTLSARESAALAARTADLDTVQKLHDLLTPAQRGQLVDAAEARFHANAESWKGDGSAEHRGHGRLEEIAERLGLTDSQRAQILANLHAEHPASGDAGGHPNFHGAGTAWLESFRGDAFNATAAGPKLPQQMERRAHRMEDLLVAAVPVLSPAQRAQLASHLRSRAARESHS
jgi:Spy/CpxP family protein refolding chaperone